MTDTRGAVGKALVRELEELTLEKCSVEGFENARANADRIARDPSILALRDSPIMEGDEALVIAAGPSLYKQDVPRMLKEANYDGVVISTESSLSWCLRHDVVPDLVITLDPHPTRIVRWFGDPELDAGRLASDDYFERQEQDPNFRTDQLRKNRELIELIDRYGPRIKIAAASCASSTVVQRIEQSGMRPYWWNPMYDDPAAEDSLTRKIHATNGLPCLNAGGNVGTACWVFAHAVLQKKRVGLLGIDFGYHAGTPYRNTQYYTEIVELVGEDNLDDVFVHFTNPHTETDFFTDPAYLWYREAFLEMAQQADCETINLAEAGILFGPGIGWSTLTEFLARDAGR